MINYGFTKELDISFEDALKQATENLKKTGFFNPDYVKKILDYDKYEVKGSRHGLKLWMLITFQLWYEQFFAESL